MRLKVRDILLLLTMSFGALSCNKEPATLPVEEDRKEVVLNVDVIVPREIREQWSESIAMAQDAIALAQNRVGRPVRLNLRYHNEDTEDLDALGYALTHPGKDADTCHAVVGPYYSDNAQHILRYAREERLPVLMPTCTSAELQRIYSNETYAWFFTESDITQCEIMIGASRAVGGTDVAMIYSDDTYGQSFKDWFAFYATEQEIHMAVEAPYAYSKGQNIRPFLQAASDAAQGDKVFVLVALSEAGLYEEVCRQIADFPHLFPICADDCYESRIINTWDDRHSFYLGVTPVGSMNHGYPQSYKELYGRLPYRGEAQVYDALCLLALGQMHRMVNGDRCIIDGKQVEYLQSPYTIGLTDHMRSIVASKEGDATQWDAAGLTTAFTRICAGKPVSLNGATGYLTFAEGSYTSILNTTYMLWSMGEGADKVEPVCYLSASGSNTEASVTAMWERDKHWEQVFSDTPVDHELGPVESRWAVVVSPSTTWSNYRHQADAFAMYQLLRRSGYDDDHIVLIVEDNLYNDPRNIYPGQIFVERGGGAAGDAGIMGEDVRAGAVVDYHFTDLELEDLAHIMMGESSEHLPQVIHPDASSNVFFFWSGHGGDREGPLWGDEDAREYFGKQRIRNIVTAMQERKLYRRMFFAIETCYSGRWGEALKDIPDILVLTAANSYEPSKADVHSRELRVYLSNAFARTFRDCIVEDNQITIYNLYKELARTTNGSHVSIYNHAQYGSVYTENMEDYFLWRE
jgi:glycosylphosphatidylinositol transamidase (GPIT) subunit GPI8